jgi:hypothetical protein
MKPTRLIFNIVILLSLSLASRAATFSFDWKLSLAENPTALDVNSSTNSSGVSITATFRGNNNTYFSGTAPGGANGYFGPPTGLWDVSNGDLLISVNSQPCTPLDCTLVITHFVDGQWYPGIATSSPFSNYTSVSRTVVVPQVGNMGGYWAADTYTWNQVTEAFLVPIRFDIIPGTGNGGAMLLDEVRFEISGGFAPEPGISQIAATGLVVFGLGCWFRRKRRSLAGPARIS